MLEPNNTLEITTCIGCKAMCQPCPQETLINAYKSDKKILSPEDFITCINKVPTSVRIDFSGMCEPWQNPHCTNMLVIAVERGNPVCIYSTAVGMTKRDAEIICGYPQIKPVEIHIPDISGNFGYGVTEEYNAVLSTLAGHPHSHFATMGTKDPRITAVNAASYGLHSRGGNVKSIPDTPVLGSITCANNYTHNVLLPDGTVLPCCMDYGITMPLGNLLTDTYESLHSGEGYQAAKAMEGKNVDYICRHCIVAKRK
jgi:hypothetical protein